MDFGQSIAYCFSNYANFNGRARRKEYWMYTLILTVLLIALMAIMFSALSLSDETRIETGPSGYLTVLLLFVFLVVHFIPSLALTVRRLHDTGKSGWWYLIVFVPYLGNFVIFIFTLIDGDEGENKYGPNPKL